MRTITQNIFQFNELDDGAKEKARQWWRECGMSEWCEESQNSINTFCNHFGVKLKDWEVDQFDWSYSSDYDNANFRGMKLRQFKRDNMPTGYCLDCDLWMTFYDTFESTGDCKAAFEAGLEAGFKSWRDDLAWQDSDEYIDENIRINEYEFFENGERA